MLKAKKVVMPKSPLDPGHDVEVGSSSAATWHFHTYRWHTSRRKLQCWAAVLAMPSILLAKENGWYPSLHSTNVVMLSCEPPLMLSHVSNLLISYCHVWSWSVSAVFLTMIGHTDHARTTRLPTTLHFRHQCCHWLHSRILLRRCCRSIVEVLLILSSYSPRDILPVCILI